MELTFQCTMRGQDKKQSSMALAAASALSTEEREELIEELILSIGRDREAEPGYDEAWSAEVRRRVDAVVRGASKGTPWTSVQSEVAAKLAERRRRTE